MLLGARFHMQALNFTCLSRDIYKNTEDFPKISLSDEVSKQLNTWFNNKDTVTDKSLEQQNVHNAFSQLLRSVLIHCAWKGYSKDSLYYILHQEP